VREYSIAKRFGVHPWEACDVPEYWIERAQLFDKVFEQVDAHRAKQQQEQDAE